MKSMYEISMALSPLRKQQKGSCYPVKQQKGSYYSDYHKICKQCTIILWHSTHH